MSETNKKENEKEGLESLVKTVRHDLKSNIGNIIQIIDLLLEHWNNEIKPKINYSNKENNDYLTDFEDLLELVKSNSITQKNYIESTIVPEIFSNIHQTENYDVKKELTTLVNDNNTKYGSNRILNLYFTNNATPTINTSKLTNMLLGNLISNGIKYGHSDIDMCGR